MACAGSSPTQRYMRRPCLLIGARAAQLQLAGVVTSARRTKCEAVTNAGHCHWFRPRGRQVESRAFQRLRTAKSPVTVALPYRPMLIGIEIRHIRIGASGGIVPLLTGVLDSLIAANPQHEFVVFRTIFNRGVVDEDRANVRTVLLPISDNWTPLQESLDRERVEVLFRAYPALDQLTFPLDRQIVLIPDLQHEQHPEFFTTISLQWRKLAFGRALRGAGAIAALSGFVRSTIMASPENACPDVFVMSPALRQDVAAATSTDVHFAGRLEAVGRYFYYPANLWKHKNHRRVIQAFDLFRKTTGSIVSFVFTGHPEGWDDIVKEFPHLPLHHFGFVSGGDQRVIYRTSLATVFFSLYEGFGMPLLEAFAADSPVICSNTTSLPEVGEGAVLSCDPTDIVAMAELMTRIAESPDLRQSLVLAGRKRLDRYSWQRSAAELMAAIERVAQRIPMSSPTVASIGPSFDSAWLRRGIAGVLSRTRRFGLRVRRALARKRVKGLWPDYWLEPCATFYTPGIARHASLFFSGRSPCDGSVAVMANNRVLTTIALRADHPVDIEFPSPRTGSVQLRFSSSIIDSQQRQVSFRLDATNVMEEADFL